MNDWVCSDALVMPCKHRFRLRKLQVFSAGLVIDLVEFQSIDQFTGQEGCFARIGDFDLLQHLARNDLDMLVIDLHALQSIDLLDFLDQVVCKSLDPHHPQNIMRHRVAVHQRIATLDDITFLDSDRLALRQQNSTGSASFASGWTKTRRLFL